VEAASITGPWAVSKTPVSGLDQALKDAVAGGQFPEGAKEVLDGGVVLGPATAEYAACERPNQDGQYAHPGA
jgi:hypothetical protein